MFLLIHLIIILHQEERVVVSSFVNFLSLRLFFRPHILRGFEGLKPFHTAPTVLFIVIQAGVLTVKSLAMSDNRKCRLRKSALIIYLNFLLASLNRGVLLVVLKERIAEVALVVVQLKLHVSGYLLIFSKLCLFHIFCSI